jgi:hypothetical protein
MEKDMHTSAGPSREVADRTAGGYPDTVDIAREIAIDLRAELSRIDSRAAAGVALVAAILVGVVSQTPARMPIFAVAIAAAILLTIALLLFLMVLLPTPTLPSQRSLVGVRAGRRADRGRDGPDSSRNRDAGWWRGTRELETLPLEEKARRLATELARLDRPEYYATLAIEINAQVHAKERLLMAAFVNGTAGVAALALGASWALLLGWR